MTSRIVRMCSTRYLGPTDHRGGRVKATHLTTRKSVTVSWDHALGIEENHAHAAAAVLGREPEFGTSVDGGGYVFGVDPANNDLAADAADYEQRWLAECRAHGETRRKLQLAHHELGEHSLCDGDCEPVEGES